MQIDTRKALHVIRYMLRYMKRYIGADDLKLSPVDGGIKITADKDDKRIDRILNATLIEDAINPKAALEDMLAEMSTELKKNYPDGGS